MSYLEARVQKVLVQPINLVFRFLQSHARVIVWIRDSVNKRFEGVIVGFDEYMNLVLADAVEMNTRTNFNHKIGTILLRGEIVTLIQSANPDENYSKSLHTARASTRPSSTKAEPKV